MSACGPAPDTIQTENVHPNPPERLKLLLTCSCSHVKDFGMAVDVDSVADVIAVAVACTAPCPMVLAGMDPITPW
jgi:hypothetical protein